MTRERRRDRKEKTGIKSKEHFYRGKTLEELKTLEIREAAKYYKARSRRSVLRNFDTTEKCVKRCEKKIIRNKKIKTHLRDIVIVPRQVGYTIGVHNGQHFNEVTITLEMVGHRLGEFSPTRGRVNHGSAGIGATKSSRAQKK